MLFCYQMADVTINETVFEEKMTNKSQRVITVILGTLLGTLVSGALCFPVWYFVNDYVRPSGFLAHWPALWGIIGFGFGAVGGFLIGLVVTAGRLGKTASGFTGLIINGLLIWTIFTILDGPNTYYPNDPVRRDFYYDSIGQAIVGVAVGLLISIFASYMGRLQSKMQ